MQMHMHTSTHLYNIRNGKVAEPTEAARAEEVLWSNANCSSAAPGASCPHSNTWFYTANDARLGQACQVRWGAGRGQHTSTLQPWDLWRGG